MSEKKMSPLEEAEAGRRVADELLFLVLDKIGEPVVIDMAKAKETSIKDRAIDINFDLEAGTATLEVINVPDTV